MGPQHPSHPPVNFNSSDMHHPEVEGNLSEGLLPELIEPSLMATDGDCIVPDGDGIVYALGLVLLHQRKQPATCHRPPATRRLRTPCNHPTAITHSVPPPASCCPNFCHHSAHVNSVGVMVLGAMCAGTNDLMFSFNGYLWMFANCLSTAG